MLTELHVRNLGVVVDATVLFGAGMTAVTGETGAGKTLLVDAIRLLTGGKGESHLVGSDAAEAWIEGRFVAGDREVVITRVVPREGRSRAYVDGRMTPVSSLVEFGGELVDLYGQHGHHRLYSPSWQRESLDAYAGTDLTRCNEICSSLRAIAFEKAKLGGDVQMRAREADLVRYQLDEIEAAELVNGNEEADLIAEEEVRSNVLSLQDSATLFHEALSGEGAILDRLGAVRKVAANCKPFADLEKRLEAVSLELEDVVREATSMSSSWQDDPQRLAWVQQRRAALKALQRKYGPTLGQVIEYREELSERLDEALRHDDLVAQLDLRRDAALTELIQVEKAIGDTRRQAAPVLAAEVERRLADLALPHARFAIETGQDRSANDVTFCLGPNPGMPLLPLAKAASGGELARAMLALCLALLTNRQPGNLFGDATAQVAGTLVFDEVDAGVGGQAAIAVGQALADLARAASPDGKVDDAERKKEFQVLVVTHLPQVAAFADHQILVEKIQDASTTHTRFRTLDNEDREIELARMLAGRASSESGRAHARELLAHAGHQS